VRAVIFRLACLACLLAACGSEGVSRTLGAACDDSADCEFRCLPDPEWPGGFCTRDCLDDRDCADEARCAATGDGSVCLYSCLDDRDCAFLEGGSLAGRTWLCRDRGNGPTLLVCVGVEASP